MDAKSGNQGMHQDPMSYETAKVACQLVESTERFLTTAAEIHQSNNAMGENPNDCIKRVIQQYEHVCMIVSVLQSISSFVRNYQSQNSLYTAANSASTTAFTALSRIYSLLITLKIEDAAARESLRELGLLVQQSRVVNLKVEDNPTHVVATQVMDVRATVASASPTPQTMDYERRELDRKRKQFEQEKEEFERERKRILLERDNTIKIQQKLKDQEKLEQQQKQKQRLEQQQKQRLEQQERLEQQQKQKQQQETQRMLDQKRLIKQQQKQEKNELAKQKQEIHVLSTDQFLKQFEETAQSFAESINMDIDNVWESMLLHALPKDKLPWAEGNIFGKNYAWRDAKHLYSEKYAQKLKSELPSWGPSASAATTTAASAVGAADAAAAATAAASISMPTMPTAAFATTNNVVNAAPKKVIPLDNAVSHTSASATTVSAAQPKEQDQRRVADYCQHLLSLEMKFYDTIEEYNKRYMRYCVIANVDVTGKSFIDRYIRSLNPKYRDMIKATIILNQVPLNNINQAMALAENVVNTYLARNPPRNNAPYSQNCVHNRKINQTV